MLKCCLSEWMAVALVAVTVPSGRPVGPGPNAALFRNGANFNGKRETWATCAANSTVDCDELRLDQLGEGGVAGVVGRQVPAQLPRVGRDGLCRVTARSLGVSGRRRLPAWSWLISPASSWRRMMFAASHAMRVGAARSGPASWRVAHWPSLPTSRSIATTVEASQTTPPVQRANAWAQSVSHLAMDAAHSVARAPSSRPFWPLTCVAPAGPRDGPVGAPSPDFSKGMATQLPDD